MSHTRGELKLRIPDFGDDCDVITLVVFCIQVTRFIISVATFTALPCDDNGGGAEGVSLGIPCCLNLIALVASI